MRSGPFAPRFEELPQTLPIFPLTGVLLLPRGKLPLNIFEPRYLAMTEDALHGDRLIGMMQPLEEDAAGDQPPVFPVGCAGRITQFSETDDGRFLITLTGLCRFRIDRELPLFLRLSPGGSRVLGLPLGFRDGAADVRSRAAAFGFEGVFEAEAALGGVGVDRERAGRTVGHLSCHDLPVLFARETSAAGGPDFA